MVKSKIVYSNHPIKSFGGFHFIYKLFSTHSIKNLIDKILGERAANSQHSNGDALLGFFSSYLVGGTCLEDVNRMRYELNDVDGSRVCSPDTLARIIGDLTCEGQTVRNNNGGTNTLVDNDLLNDLLVNMAGLNLRNEIDPILDIDAHILVCEKKDSDYTYNNLKGYAPMVGFINRVPVRIQNRSGNTSPAYGHVDFVKKLLAGLNKQNIHPKYFRADAASYNEDLMDILEREGIRFYIRAKNSNSLLRHIKNISEDQWEQMGYPDKKSLEIAEITYKGYRLVVQRTKKKNLQMDLFDSSQYQYRAIITNDTRVSMNGMDVILFYNDRGDSERNFDILQNDFGWAKLPMDNISLNTTYLLITAFFMSLYEWVKSKLSKMSKMVNIGMRTKNFLLNILLVPAKVRYRSRQRIITFFSERRFQDFEKLLI